MPIYEQTYRTYEGKARGWLRWWVMVTQELRVLSRSWAFRGLFGLGMLHVFFRGIQVLGYDLISSRPERYAISLQDIAMLEVNTRMFFDFIRMQSPIVFVTTILAGSGMIANDFRYNLMEIYFSKPLTWRDYVVGKSVALIIVGLLLTAVPGLLLLAMHNLLLPGMDTLRETYWWAGSITLFSLALVLPCALGVLAGSALLSSQRFAGIAVFMVLLGDSTIGTTLPNLLHERNYLIIAFPMAINHVGQHLFKDSRLEFDLHWKWAVLFIALVCLVSLWVVCRKARRAEVAT